MTEATTRRTIFNVTFHGIGEPAHKVDAGEAAVWVSARNFQQVLDALAPRSDIHITFDDGNDSDALIALPHLQSRKLTAEFFVLAGRLDAPHYLSRSHVRDLHAAGMGVGVHGWSHRAWNALSSSDLTEELLTARKMLEDLLGTSITHAACPFGAYNRLCLSHLQTAGYTRVYTSDRGPANPAAWLQPRNTIRASDTADSVRLLVTNASPFTNLARNAKMLIKQYR